MPGSRVFFIRHAAVVLHPGRAATKWELSDEGVAGAQRLAFHARFARVERVATSSEPKAVATASPLAQRLGLELHADDDLREATRGALPILPRKQYVALVRRYLSGETPDGWETQEAARARFAAAVDRHRAETTGDLAIVSHGLVISLHLGLTAERWEALRLPDVLEVEE